ncbi:MAG: hypothetical protein Q9166_003236 [cf. Caloplaca sp. 2 TL-2023]
MITRRLSKRLIAYLLLAALLVFWARRTLPSRRIWAESTLRSGNERSEQPASAVKNGDASRYSHWVENVPAPPKANTGETNLKDKFVGRVGSRADLEAKTDNMLAQWIAREQEASNSEDSQNQDEHRPGDGSTTRDTEST